LEGLFRYYWIVIKLVPLVAAICVDMFLFDPAGMAAATEGARPAGATGQWVRWGC
jgi:hypothetical protein